MDQRYMVEAQGSAGHHKKVRKNSTLTPLLLPDPPIAQQATKTERKIKLERLK